MSNCCNYHYVAGASDFNRHKSHKSHKSGGRDHNFLQSLVGKNVKVNRGGPDSLQGKLLAVKSDYLVLSTKEGVVYVASSHVKSITEMSGNKSGGNKSDGNKSGNKSGRRDPEFVDANNFNGVIRSFNQKFVQINWGGPEKVEGFIAQVGNGSILLVSGKEAMQIQNDHIKTIKAAGHNKSGGNKNDNKKDSKSNKTQGNRANTASVNAAPIMTRRSM